MSQPLEYLNPNLPCALARCVMPVVDATPETLAGYGKLAEDPKRFEIEIVPWPAQGRRPVDPCTADEAGTTQGGFLRECQGAVLYGPN